MGMTWADVFERREQRNAERLKERPVCHACGEHIQGDYRYRIDGVVYCEDCMRDIFEEYNEPEFYEEGYEE